MAIQFFTRNQDYFKGTSPEALLSQFGGPLYVYHERILRERCRQMKTLVPYPRFTADYSVKANTNLALLKIVHEEGLHADAMSPGEMTLLLAAGFQPEEIFFVCNNVSPEEMAFAVERGITVSVDSLSQLETFGKRFPGAAVAVRFNSGHGVGHHEKVTTAGKHTKFGISGDEAQEVKAVVKRHGLKLVGINQHLGSLFMEPETYFLGSSVLMDLATQFEELSFIDLGGGFGIPYHKQEGQQPLDLVPIYARLGAMMEAFSARCGRQITFKVEPGRFIPAECCVLLGTVWATKENSGTRYVGTDLGFNVLQRPVMYNSYHELEVYRNGQLLAEPYDQIQTVVGNICETGDILAKNRPLPLIQEGDILGVMDAGAYGFSMASSYNSRPRPAEVLLPLNGPPRLIRRRETIEDLMRQFEV